jgi:hypothetical protein
MKLEFVKMQINKVHSNLLKPYKILRIVFRSDFYCVFIIELGCIDRIFESKVGKNKMTIKFKFGL